MALTHKKEFAYVNTEELERLRERADKQDKKITELEGKIKELETDYKDLLGVHVNLKRKHGEVGKHFAILNEKYKKDLEEIEFLKSELGRIESFEEEVDRLNEKNYELKLQLPSPSAR